MSPLSTPSILLLKRIITAVFDVLISRECVALDGMGVGKMVRTKTLTVSKSVLTVL
jgi:hypothetical protein